MIKCYASVSSTTVAGCVFAEPRKVRLLALPRLPPLALVVPSPKCSPCPFGCFWARDDSRCCSSSTFDIASAAMLFGPWPNISLISCDFLFEVFVARSIPAYPNANKTRQDSKSPHIQKYTYPHFHFRTGMFVSPSASTKFIPKMPGRDGGRHC